MKTEEIADILAQTRLFGGSSRAALLSIASEANQRTYPKGAVLFNEGDTGDAFYVVASGTVKVFVTSGHGTEMVMATLRAPHGFGEVALLDNGPRSASAEALEPTTVLAFARSTFLDLIHRDPDVADGLLRSVGWLLRRVTGQAADLVFLDLEGRVAKLLVEFANERGEEREGEIHLDLGLSQSDLAVMVGGSRQSVNQILHALEARGYLAVDGGRTVAILNMEGLSKRAGLP